MKTWLRFLLTIEDTDEEIDEQNEGNEGGPGWSAMASMCKPSSSHGRRKEKLGEENQWLNIRSFLGSFPFYRSRSIFLGSLRILMRTKKRTKMLKMKEMKAGQAGLLWRQSANHHPLLEEG